MQHETLKARDRSEAHELHELSYWKHLGVSENAVRDAMAKVGTDRGKIARELQRSE